jgi:formate hydrogenlyase subunit 6/NADH:ubiquinone oxidoreductase subunit I
MLKLFRAYLSLALRALVLHPLHAIFGRAGQRGKQLFLANYAGEGLVPYSPADRAALPRFSGCVNCGLCDAVCPLQAAPSLFALAYSRATPELRSLRGALLAVERCGDCRLCQDTCPRGVPLLEIFAFSRRKLTEVDAALETRDQALEPRAP